MKMSLKAFLLFGVAVILTSRISPLLADDSSRSSSKGAVERASLDDLIGVISQDNASMGMTPSPSPNPDIPRHDRDRDDGSARMHRPVGLPVLAEPSSAVQPAMVPNPATTSPVAPPDYTGMLAAYHVRMAEDKDLLSRQFIKGGLTQDQYDNDRKALDDLANVEGNETDGNNGSLTGDQIVDLSRSLEQIHKKILQDLSS